MKLNYFVGSLLVMMCTIDVCTANEPSISCCTEKDTTPIKAEEIVSYVLENPPCYIGAVRFLLINNRTRCSDPERLWAKRAIKIINIRNTTKAPKTSPSSTTSCTLELTTSTTQTPTAFTATKLPPWTTTTGTTEKLFNERTSAIRTPTNMPTQTSTRLTTGNWRESTITPIPTPETIKETDFTVTVTDSSTSTKYTNHTSRMLESSQKTKMQSNKKTKTVTGVSQIAEKEREALHSTERFCLQSETEETWFCYYD
ncbi:uncharacterized protein LOC131356472 [Hemibagrus wyckioides]|uniref:uncharacterized protein LOC131356472 n=1 Tax=Hemibagrus wyckioides TaxID=337641 RepID=UPI00266D89F2|nr:uncharacterized protein LOC131356472 [Hemibagrus wyckioides]